MGSWDTPPTAEETAGFDPDAYLRQKGPRWAQDPIIPNWAQAPTVEEWERARRVTDPALLARLEGGQRVTDPRLLRQIEGVQESPRRKMARALTSILPMPGSSEQENLQGAEQAIGLGMGMTMPAIPGVSRAAGWLGKKLFPGAAQAVQAAAPVAEQAAPAAVRVAEQAAPEAANAFEAAARASKVQEMVKAIDANAGAHLGVDARDPRFAAAIADMPQQWWEGMGQVAKINKPSATTVGDVVAFFKDRAAQATRAIPEAAPAVAVAPPVPAPTPVPTPAPAGGGLPGFLNRSGSKLEAMKPAPVSVLDLLLGHHGLTHGGTVEGAAGVLASQLLRRYGPPVAGKTLQAIGRGAERLTPYAVEGGAPVAGQLAAPQLPRLMDVLKARGGEDWLDTYLREKQALSQETP